MMLILIVAGRVAHDAATVASSTSAHNSVTESLKSVTYKKLKDSRAQIQLQFKL